MVEFRKLCLVRGLKFDLSEDIPIIYQSSEEFSLVRGPVFDLSEDFSIFLSTQRSSVWSEDQCLTCQRTLQTYLGAQRSSYLSEDKQCVSSEDVSSLRTIYVSRQKTFHMRALSSSEELGRSEDLPCVRGHFTSCIAEF